MISVGTRSKVHPDRSLPYPTEIPVVDDDRAGAQAFSPGLEAPPERR